MPDTFTPEQIAQILEEFFKVVGTRQYIGARYVPIFGRKDETSIEWDNTAPYEPLTIVLYQGNSYTSRQYVPVGVEITNQEFWAVTGNYNAQVELYRRETAAAKATADHAQATADHAQATADNAQASANNAQTSADNAQKSANNAQKSANNAQSAADSAQNDINTLLPKSNFSGTNTVKKYIDDSDDVLLNFSKANTFGQYVDDIEFVASIPTPSGYTMGAITFDSNGRLYVCFISSGQNSIIRYFNNFANRISESPIQYDGEFSVANTHCNAISYMPEANKLCIFDWNVNQISLVDIANDFTEEIVTTPFAIRTGCTSYDNIIIQPYNANSIYMLNKTTKQGSDYSTGYYIPLCEIMSQVSYVQDCCTLNSLMYRLCSSGAAQINNGGSYIEIYPIYSGGNPVEVGITTDYNAEFEGISPFGNYFYLSTANSNIYRSNKMRNISIQIREGASSYILRTSSIFLSSEQARISHVPYDVLEDGRTFRLYLPSLINQFVGNRNMQLLIPMKFHSITGFDGWHSGGSVVLHITHQGGTEQMSFVGNTSNGLYILLLTVTYNTAGYVDVHINTYRTISASGSNVSMGAQSKWDDFVLENPDFSLCVVGV